MVPEVPTRGGDAITVRFDGVPLGRALATLGDLTGHGIVWAETLDSKEVFGYFRETPIGVVLDAVGRRVGASVNDIDGVYFVGELGPDDLASAVVALPPGKGTEIEAGLAKLISSKGRLVVLGGSIWIRDSVSVISSVLREVEALRRHGLRRYVVEVYLIRVEQRALLDLAAELQISGVDLLSGPNLGSLFSMLLEADGSRSGAEVIHRPVLLCADGQEARLHVGKTVTVAERSVTEAGAVETTGYRTFDDGFELTLTVHRSGPGMLSALCDLSLSEFGAESVDGVPDKTSEEVHAGLVLADGEVCLVGGLGRRGFSRGARLFGGSVGREEESVLVWVRARELAESCGGPPCVTEEVEVLSEGECGPSSDEHPVVGVPLEMRTRADTMRPITDVAPERVLRDEAKRRVEEVVTSDERTGVSVLVPLSIQESRYCRSCIPSTIRV